jgi:hypothetical protein
MNMFWQIFLPTFASFWLVLGIKSAIRMVAILLNDKEAPPFQRKVMLVITSLLLGPTVYAFADGVQDFK